jgi:hypothetical protein
VRPVRSSLLLGGLTLLLAGGASAQSPPSPPSPPVEAPPAPVVAPPPAVVEPPAPAAVPPPWPPAAPPAAPGPYAGVPWNAVVVPEPAEPPESSLFPRPYGFSFSAQIDAAFREIYSIPIGAVQVECTFGARTRAGIWSGAIDVLGGSTEHGLTVLQLSLAPQWRAPIGPVQLGLAPTLSVIAVKRLTRYDSYLTSAGGGLWGLFSVDVYTFDEQALFLAARVGLEGLSEATSALWGASAGLGIRRF